MASFFNVLCYSLIIGTLLTQRLVASDESREPLTAIDRQNIDLIRQFYGERAGKRATAWRHLLHQLTNTHTATRSDKKSVSESTQLEGINRFFNQLQFIDDDKLWGKKDYWATPNEFIGVGGGDCEDFSIAKYFSLLSLGVDDEKLRLVYVKALTLNQFHMVVAYYPHPAAVPLLLDNLDGEIKPATERLDLLPIYSFNGSQLWLMKQKGQGQLAGDAAKLSAWNDVRLRNNEQELRRPAINLDE
ncbi:sulfate adenylyltransferase [Photobacterium swingsii]|uniref:Sulfate adenylyltransferase n=1 Tax=Photobacterium swingsii TaxID=680026 RepID=A0A2T3P9J4_9GAMM|nr:transglutaminase-like cysteine peptidase [Photobacterium swingsii]PSW25480.1 sulfate adenylyltransferase [Photobacterium swingsii]